VPFSKQVLLKIIDGLTLKSKQPGCLIWTQFWVNTKKEIGLINTNSK